MLTAFYIALALAAVASVFWLAVTFNKSKARTFFLEHYRVEERESIEVLQRMADSVSFTSLNAAAICLAVKLRSNSPDLGEEDLKRRFNDLWSEGTIMKTAHNLELAKKLGYDDTFKNELEQLVRNPHRA